MENNKRKLRGIAILSSVIIISLVLIYVFVKKAKPDTLGFIWLFSGIALIFFEFITPFFFALPFGVGCLVAVIPNLFRAEILVQVLVFFGASLIVWVIIGFMHSSSKDSNKGKQLNGEEMIGASGCVTESIIPPMKGRVYLKGNTWAASSETRIEKGKEVVVVSMEGITVFVKEKNR